MTTILAETRPRWFLGLLPLGGAMTTTGFPSLSGGITVLLPLGGAMTTGTGLARGGNMSAGCCPSEGR